MEILDYAIIVAFLIGITLFGMYFTKAASNSTEDFILGGRKMPWWLAGTSQVATSMNPAAPLQEAGKIQKTGLGGNWLQWSSIIDACISTVFFMRLWRRSGITTAIEFYSIRYSGRGAVFARIFDVTLLGIFAASIFAALGLVGMRKIVNVMLPSLPDVVQVMGFSVELDLIIVLTCVTMAIAYSIASGVHGVVWTDLLEFCVIIVCSFVLLFFVFKDVGGIGGLHDKLMANDVERAAEGLPVLLSWLPTMGPALIGYLLIKPIMSLGMYNPGVQRALCVKDEREVIYTSVWALFSGHTIRTWPWWICGLAGLFVLGPTVLSTGEAWDPEAVYPALIMKYLPTGLLGLMVAGFISGFMASFDTNAHNSGSIFVNDLYRPYINPNGDEKHYLKATRIFMVAITIIAVFIALRVESILELFFFALNVWNSAGIVRLMRWIWWRVNVWSEITAQVSGILMVIFVQFFGGIELVKSMFGLTSLNPDYDFTLKLITITFTSSVLSMLVAIFTKPEPKEKLDEFYQRVRPYGWWGPVAERNADYHHGDSVGLLWVTTLSMMSFAISSTIAMGAFLLGFWGLSIVCAIVFVVSVLILRKSVGRLCPDQVAA